MHSTLPLYVHIFRVRLVVLCCFYSPGSLFIFAFYLSVCFHCSLSIDTFLYSKLWCFGAAACLPSQLSSNQRPFVSFSFLSRHTNLSSEKNESTDTHILTYVSIIIPPDSSVFIRRSVVTHPSHVASIRMCVSKHTHTCSYLHDGRGGSV